MTIQRALTPADFEAWKIARTLDVCPYRDVRPGMMLIEDLYGGRIGVPADLATFIGRAIRTRKDYAELVGRNGT